MSAKKAGGCVDLKEFRGFEDKLAALGSEKAIDGFYEYAVKQMGARFLRRVIKDTPVEENEAIRYETMAGEATLNVKGGALKRGWIGKGDSGPEPSAGEQAAFLAGKPVTKHGKIYELEISNNVGYARFVEYGHRQRVGQYVPTLGKPDKHGVRHGATLKKSFVRGQYMMTNAAGALEAMAPGLARKLVDDYIRKKL